MLDICIHDMIMFDTKANIIDGYGFVGQKVAKESSQELQATS